jgi:hypothetical protein
MLEIMGNILIDLIQRLSLTEIRRHHFMQPPELVNIGLSI